MSDDQPRTFVKWAACDGPLVEVFINGHPCGVQRWELSQEPRELQKLVIVAMTPKDWDKGPRKPKDWGVEK